MNETLTYVEYCVKFNDKNLRNKTQKLTTTSNYLITNGLWYINSKQNVLRNEC